MRFYTAFATLLLFSAANARAADDEFGRLSLRGLKGVVVLVSPLPVEVEQNGLMASAIQTDVELRLRQAGIPILNSTRRSPALIVGVDILTYSDGTWPFLIGVAVSQSVILSRDPSILLPSVETWNENIYGSLGRKNVRSLRDHIKDSVDKFINAYLAANPKK